MSLPPQPQCGFRDLGWVPDVYSNGNLRVQFMDSYYQGFTISCTGAQNVYGATGSTGPTGVTGVTGPTGPDTTFVGNEFTIIKELATGNGGVGTPNTWVTRQLSSIQGNSTSINIVSNTTFTVVSGRYYIRAFAPCYNVTNHMCRLFNVTSGAVLVLGGITAYGTSEVSLLSMTKSIVEGYLSMGVTTEIRLESAVAVSNGTMDFGLATNQNESIETYSIIYVQKIG